MAALSKILMRWMYLASIIFNHEVDILKGQWDCKGREQNVQMSYSILRTLFPNPTVTILSIVYVTP
jgi:hypothetical protein